MFTGGDVAVGIAGLVVVTVALAFAEPVLDNPGNVVVRAECQVLSHKTKLSALSVTFFVVFEIALTGIIFCHSSQFGTPVLQTQTIQKTT